MRRFAVTTTALCALSLALAGGFADAGLKDRIDAAKEDAEALEEKIQARGEQIAALEQRTEEARARIGQLTQELASGKQRSAQAATELATAEAELAAARKRLERARAVLAQRLVEIYKEGETSYVELILSSDGFDDISTRLEYMKAIAHSDERAAARVRELSELVEDEVARIDALKAEIDEHNRELAAAREEVAETRAELGRQTDELAAAKAAAADDLAAIRSTIDELRAELSSKQLGALFGNGEWAIPEYIVMCESGGNYHALNPSSGAGGAYQILPSTWRAYGGKGLPHQAPPAEQDRIAGEIWRNSGPSQWVCA